MRWGEGALVLAAGLASLAGPACTGARPWAVDEADRIDALMAPETSAEAPALPPDAGMVEDEAIEDGLDELSRVLAEPLAMGPALPLAAPTSRAEQLGPEISWSDRPWRRGRRVYLGYRHRWPAKGRDPWARSRGAGR